MAETAALSIARLRTPGAFRSFRRIHKRAPDLRLLRRNQDKILWRKLFDHNPLFVTFNDKLAAKRYAREHLPDLRIPETLWVGPSARDIPERWLRERVMIKANNGWNFNVFHEADPGDRARIEALFSQWLTSPFGRETGQWAYGEITPQVFVEERITQADGSDCETVLVHVMDGAPVYVGVGLGPKTGARQLSFFDPDGRRLPFKIARGIGRVPETWRPGPGFFNAVAAARILARDIDYLRCDFLVADEEIWFSELTTYVADALAVYDDPAAADRYHAPWDLRQSWFLRTRQQGWREAYRQALRARLDREADAQRAGVP
jgi:hypothetical protein